MFRTPKALSDKTWRILDVWISNNEKTYFVQKIGGTRGIKKSNDLKLWYLLRIYIYSEFRLRLEMVDFFSQISVSVLLTRYYSIITRHHSWILFNRIQSRENTPGIPPRWLEIFQLDTCCRCSNPGRIPTLFLIRKKKRIRHWHECFVHQKLSVISH